MAPCFHRELAVAAGPSPHTLRMKSNSRQKRWLRCVILRLMLPLLRAALLVNVVPLFRLRFEDFGGFPRLITGVVVILSRLLLSRLLLVWVLIVGHMSSYVFGATVSSDGSSVGLDTTDAFGGANSG
jgi:uncharacterized membrane protein